MLKRSLVFTGLLAVIAQSATAQPFRELPTEGPGAYAPPQVRFDEAPGIGDPPPDVTIFDRDGNPVVLRDLTRENYSVLVLGCLT